MIVSQLKPEEGCKRDRACAPLLDPINGRALDHLHRRVIEIRDCQQRGMTLLPRDRILVNQAEQLLQGN